MPKLQVYQKKVNPTDEGSVVDMAHFDTGETYPSPVGKNWVGEGEKLPCRD